MATMIYWDDKAPIVDDLRFALPVIAFVFIPMIAMFYIGLHPIYRRLMYMHTELELDESERFIQSEALRVSYKRLFQFGLIFCIGTVLAIQLPFILERIGGEEISLDFSVSLLGVGGVVLILVAMIMLLPITHIAWTLKPLDPETVELRS